MDACKKERARERETPVSVACASLSSADFIFADFVKIFSTVTLLISFSNSFLKSVILELVRLTCLDQFSYMQVSTIDLDRLIYIICKLETHKLVLFECLRI